MRSVRIDGNDVFAVYFHTLDSLEKARNGEGPTLIEAVTWRYGAHTTADDPTKYRDQSENEKRRENDPILRLERFMKNQGWFTEDWKESMLVELSQEVDSAIEEMENFPKADPADMFDYVFEKPTWGIEQQKQELLQLMRGEA